MDDVAVVLIQQVEVAEGACEDFGLVVISLHVVGLISVAISSNGELQLFNTIVDIIEIKPSFFRDFQL